MKHFGLRIGDVGIEFPSREEREKALLAFTKGSDVKIYDDGVKYRDGKSTFSVYERMTENILVTCSECRGIFGIDVCPKGDFPSKRSYDNEYSTEDRHLCDACLISITKAKEIFEAKKLLNKGGDKY